MKYLLFLLFIACAQHQVGSNEAGVFIAKHSSLDKKDALKTALEYARVQCDGDRMILVSKNVEYEGKLSEAENEKVKDSSNKSIMMGEGGMAQTDYALKGDNLYHAVVRFRCK